MTRAQQYHARRHTYARTILRTYGRAASDDLRTGLQWYPRAVRGVDSWAGTLGLPRETVACVIAALSPQCQWDANLRAALGLLTGGEIPTDGGVLRANIRKATAVLADRATSLDGYFIAGPKVKAFSRNLMGDGTSVTVDVHAAQAALGLVEHAATAVRLTPDVYEVFADCYRAASSLADLRPCDLQAVVWTTWKREHPTVSKRRDIHNWSRVGNLKELW